MTAGERRTQRRKTKGDADAAKKGKKLQEWQEKTRNVEAEEQKNIKNREERGMARLTEQRTEEE